MDCCLPSPSVHGIFQASVLEWVVIAFSRYVLGSMHIIVGKKHIFSRISNIQSFSKTLKSRLIWAPNGPMIMDMDYFPPLNIYSHPVSNEFINLLPEFVGIFIFVKFCIILILFTYVNIYIIFFSETEVAESKKKIHFLLVNKILLCKYVAEVLWPFQS